MSKNIIEGTLGAIVLLLLLTILSLLPLAIIEVVTKGQLPPDANGDVSEGLGIVLLFSGALWVVVLSVGFDHIRSRLRRRHRGNEATEPPKC